MLSKLFGHFAQLGDFSGRERRGVFWPWVGLLVWLAMMVNFLIMSQLVMPVFLVAQTNDEIIGAMHVYSLSMGGIALVSIGLLAAAVSRRLHDAGKPVWVGLLPLPFLAFGLFWFTRVVADTFAGDEIDAGFTGAFMLGFLNNLVYMGTLVLLVVFLAQPSEPGENRHGPEPD